MDRERAEQILSEQGWTTDGKVDSSGNSTYVEWYKDGVTAYVGNWFLEVETFPHAFPYKDAHAREEDLIEFIELNED